MMKIALYSRPNVSHTAEELQTLFDALHDFGFDVQINRAFALQVEQLTGREFPVSACYQTVEEIDPQTRMLMSYGGDGTFLEAVRMLNLRELPIVGINSGRLGFLANISPEGLRGALRDLAADRYRVEARPLLKAQGDSLSGSYPYAFNELGIQRYGSSMIATDVFVNDELIATSHGDGMLISTAAGSTAYSLSVGGPVLSPECRCFVISPIAPHNLTMRPVVVPDTVHITLKVHTRGAQCSLSLDNCNYPAVDGAEVHVSKAEKSIFLVQFQNISFYDTLRNKMMWGIDGRDSQNKNG